MTSQSSHAGPNPRPPGASTALSVSIGRNVTKMLLAKEATRVRACGCVGRMNAPRRCASARPQVMQGDLTDLTAMHGAIEGCARVYFGMSVSSDYLTATVNTAAVARHHGVEAFVNMSQMTVTQMSICHHAAHCLPRRILPAFRCAGRTRRQRAGVANGQWQDLALQRVMKSGQGFAGRPLLVRANKGWADPSGRLRRSQPRPAA